MRRRFRKPRGGEPSDPDAPGSGDGGPDAFERLLERQLDERIDMAVLDTAPPGAPEPDLDRISEPVTRSARAATPARSPGPPDGPGFWDLYDRAAAEAELARVTPASVVAVVGPLDEAVAVARRCRDDYWMGVRDVHVLSQRPDLPDDTDWIRVERPSDLVAVLEEDRGGFPVLVLDVPSELPAFVEPLVARLRDCGLGLVHYVLDGDPDDEDLATWYGRLGRPSVLDLVSPIEPARILELIDRGEPVVSVAGMALTPELLLAFRLESGDLMGGP